MQVDLPWFVYRDPQQRLLSEERFNLYKQEGALNRKKKELERLYLSN